MSSFGTMNVKKKKEKLLKLLFSFNPKMLKVLLSHHHHHHIFQDTSSSFLSMYALKKTFTLIQQKIYQHKLNSKTIMCISYILINEHNVSLA